MGERQSREQIQDNIFPKHGEDAYDMQNKQRIGEG